MKTPPASRARATLQATLRRCALCLVCLPALVPLPNAARAEETVDFSDQITPTCELIGLVGQPPAGWFNVPIESPGPNLLGCQMMRAGENEELVGIMRLLSLVVPDGTPEEEWFPAILELEVTWLGEMGITLGETLFARENVPSRGPGFAPGQAIGLAATIEGISTPQEVHFLGFGGPRAKYLLTLATPGREVDGGAHYQRNIGDFGVLLRTFQLPAE
jgi:hypothetical protein